MSTELIKEASNAELLDEILAARDGEVKNASTAGSNMIRRKIREQGFCRRILPPEAKGNADLNTVLEHDRPVIIEEMEPLSKGAKSIPFGDAADSTPYYGNKFACVFHSITTPEFVKDINELRTNKNDIRKIVTDNALNDIETKEDGEFMAGCESIVGASNGVGASGQQQNFVLDGGFTRDNYVEALKLMDNLDLNVGCVLINRKTAKEFIKWGRDELGGDLSQDMFKSGLTALGEAVVMGAKHIFTIKRNLVPDGCCWIFAEPSFLQKHPSMIVLGLSPKFTRWTALKPWSTPSASIQDLARNKPMSTSRIDLREAGA
jgi:hypothetical protein